MRRQEELAGVKEGDILAGKYRVDRVLGVGGMGVVVAAHHIHLDDRCAIKFLLPETLSNSDAVMRFSREARAAVKIKSEHVARVTDVGTMENGAPYMVMEYLEGGDLSAWLEAKGKLPVELAVDYVLQACEALAEAHALGIVHRDLKPANLFLAQLPGGVQSIKVLDFGISKLTGLSASGGDSSQTKTTALMGSPLYMSPEQMRASKDVDTRGDIWAIGTILYELVTGQPPYSADTMPELILKIMEAAPTPLRDLRPDAPDGLEPVILRCLEKDRTKRYQTVGELAGALAPLASRKARASIDRIVQVMQAAGMSVSSPSLPPPSDRAPRVGASTAGAFGTTAPGGGQRRPQLLIAGAVIVVLGILGVAFGRGHASDGGSSSAAPAELSARTITAPQPVQVRSPPSPAVAPVVEGPQASAPPSVAPSVPAVPDGARAAPPRGAPVVARPRAVVAAPVPAKPAAPGGPAPAAPAPKKPSDNSLIDDRQ